MKRVLLLCSLVLLLAANDAWALRPSDELNSIVQLASPHATPAQIRARLGSPTTIKEARRRTFWRYEKEGSEIVISWNNRSGAFERVSVTRKSSEQRPFDERASAKLISGKTQLPEALSIMGSPRSMLLKENRQELHYTFSNSIVRLFFRNNVLVDFTLVGKYTYR